MRKLHSIQSQYLTISGVLREAMKERHQRASSHPSFRSVGLTYRVFAVAVLHTIQDECTRDINSWTNRTRSMYRVVAVGK